MSHSIDTGIALAREMMDEQNAFAAKATSDGRTDDADAHYYAARILMALSATSGRVTRKDALSWMRDERHASNAAQRNNMPQMALECGYAATILEHLAIRLTAKSAL